MELGGMAGVGAQTVVGDWIICNKIGAGSFAVVWKAKHALTGQVVAIKEISTDKLNKKLKQSLESEVSILKQITHKNIVKLLEVIEERDRLYLVMEYCSGGDVAKYIRKHKRIPETTARALLRQLSAGLKELWSRNLVHRDLKPQNLLLSTSKSGALLKIADFGFARNLQPQGLAETLCGSPLYMAPEILQFQKYDAKADLWSVGTILFELVVGKPPFTGGNHVALLRNIERQEATVPAALVKSLSSSCVALLHGLLKRNPVERMSFEEFFMHPFLRLGSRASSAYDSSNSSQSSSLVSSAEPSPVKGPTGEEPPAAVKVPLQGDSPLPAPSPDDNLPFLLDEDPQKGAADPLQRGGTQSIGHHQPQPAAAQMTGHLPHAFPAPIALAPIDPAPLSMPPIPVPITAHTGGIRQYGSLDARSGGSSGRSGGRLSFMPSTPQQPHFHNNMLGNLLDDEEDYVIIDGPSPFGSTHASMSRHASSGSMQAGSAPNQAYTPGSTPPLGRTHLLRQQATSYHPLQHTSSSPALRSTTDQPSGSVSKAQGTSGSSMLFAAGVSRVESLMRSARILEGLAAQKQAGGAPQHALAMRLLIIQVLNAAYELALDNRTGSLAASPQVMGAEGGTRTSRDGAGRDRAAALSPERIQTEVRAAVERADESATAAGEEMDADEQLPDVWELAYRDALSFARSAAVEELLGHAISSMRAYSKAGTLLYFIFGEAPHLGLEPRVDLASQERRRLQHYTAAIAQRYTAVKSIYAASQHSGGGSGGHTVVITQG